MEGSSGNLTIALQRYGTVNQGRFTARLAMRAVVREGRQPSRRVQASDHLRLTPPADRARSSRHLSCDSYREPGWPWDTPLPSGLDRQPIQPDNTILRIIAAYEQRSIERGADEVARVIDVTI